MSSQEPLSDDAKRLAARLTPKPHRAACRTGTPSAGDEEAVEPAGSFAIGDSVTILRDVDVAVRELRDHGWMLHVQIVRKEHGETGGDQLAIVEAIHIPASS